MTEMTEMTEKTDLAKLQSISADDMLKLENQLCFPLYACARKVTGKYTPFLKPLGITYTQYLVFMVLWEYGDMNVGDLCRRLYLDSGTLTPLLKKMEGKGYLRRSRCSEDERCVNIQLTQAGMQMKEQAKDIPAKVGGCIACLDPEEIGRLHELLQRILDAVC